MVGSGDRRWVGALCLAGASFLAAEGSEGEPVPTIAERVQELECREGFLPVCWDSRA